MRTHIKKLTTHYHLTTPEVTIDLHISPTESTTYAHNLLKKLLLTILTIKALVNNILPVHFTIYLTNAKKQFPPISSPTSLTKPLGPNEVNSGSTLTISPLQNGIVHIWRKTDLQRVTVHELLHAIKADYNLFQTSYLDNRALKDFNLTKNNNINIHESYNEFNACLLTTALASKTPTKFLKNLEHERIYNIKLASHIMQHQNQLNNFPPTTTPDWLFKSKSLLSQSKTQSQPKFYQDTSVFSYYILKTALLYNLNKYLEFIRTKLPSTYPIFPPSRKMEEQFYDVQLKSVTKFRPILTKLVETSHNNKEKSKKTPTEISLDMTVSGDF